MRISNSKFKAMVWLLWVRNELLPQVMEFVLCFVHEWGERGVGAVLAVMLTLYWPVLVKSELTVTVKLSIYQWSFISTLTCGRGLWVVTEWMRSWISAAEASFLVRASGLDFTGARSFRAELLLLCIKRIQLRWFGHLTRMPPGNLLGEVLQACNADPEADPRPAGEIRSVGLLVLCFNYFILGSKWAWLVLQ